MFDDLKLRVGYGTRVTRLVLTCLLPLRFMVQLVGLNMLPIG